MTPTNDTPPTNGNHPVNGSRPGDTSPTTTDALTLRAVARELQRTTRRITAVEERTRLFDGLLAQLAADITVLAPTSDDVDDGEAMPPPSMRSWLLGTSDPEQARTLLADLVEWVRAVYVRYPGGALPSCWLWHPAVVEELCWLRHAHHTAYHGRGASWREVADWHDRLRPGVTRRISAALADCELSRHTRDGDRHQPISAVPLTAAADPVATAWATGRTTPEPTADQLAEAEAHDHAQLRTRR